MYCFVVREESTSFGDSEGFGLCQEVALFRRLAAGVIRSFCFIVVDNLVIDRDWSAALPAALGEFGAEVSQLRKRFR